MIDASGLHQKYGVSACTVAVDSLKHGSRSTALDGTRFLGAVRQLDRAARAAAMAWWVQLGGVAGARCREDGLRREVKPGGRGHREQR